MWITFTVLWLLYVQSISSQCTEDSFSIGAPGGTTCLMITSNCTSNFMGRISAPHVESQNILSMESTIENLTNVIEQQRNEITALTNLIQQKTSELTALTQRFDLV